MRVSGISPEERCQSAGAVAKWVAVHDDLARVVATDLLI